MRLGMLQKETYVRFFFQQQSQAFFALDYKKKYFSIDYSSDKM